MKRVVIPAILRVLAALGVMGTISVVAPQARALTYEAMAANRSNRVRPITDIMPLNADLRRLAERRIYFTYFMHGSNPWLNVQNGRVVPRTYLRNLVGESLTRLFREPSFKVLVEEFAAGLSGVRLRGRMTFIHLSVAEYNEVTRRHGEYGFRTRLTDLREFLGPQNETEPVHLVTYSLPVEPPPFTEEQLEQFPEDQRPEAPVIGFRLPTPPAFFHLLLAPHRSAGWDQQAVLLNSTESPRHDFKDVSEADFEEAVRTVSDALTDFGRDDLIDYGRFVHNVVPLEFRVYGRGYPANGDLNLVVDIPWDVPRAELHRHLALLKAFRFPTVQRLVPRCSDMTSERLWSVQEQWLRDAQSVISASVSTVESQVQLRSGFEAQGLFACPVVPSQP